MPRPARSSQPDAGAPRRHRVVSRGVAATAICALAGVGAAGAASRASTQAQTRATIQAKTRATGSPRFTSPRQIIASTPNVPTAVNGPGEAVTLRPGPGPGPSLELASGHGRVRSIRLGSDVPGYDNPSVAIGNSGVLAATWDTSSSSGSGPVVVEVAIGTFAAPPSNAVVLSPTGTSVSGEQAFVNSGGTTFVIWNQAESGPSGLTDVRAAVVGPGGTPRAVTIAPNESFVGAGLDAGGDLAVIEQDHGQFSQQTIAADGKVGLASDFTAPPTMSDAAAGSDELGVLVDGAGDQLYSWRPLGARKKLYAVWRAATGSFGPVQALGFTSAVASDGPQVALNATGHAVAVLAPRRSGPVGVRSASARSHFGSVVRVGARGRYADMPVLSIDAAGRTLLAWIDSPTSSRGTSRSRALAAEGRGTHFTAPTVLPVGPGLGRKYLGDAPLTAADPSGRTDLVTYGASKGTRAVGEIAFLTG